MANKGINKVILIGNLGGDPEVRYTPTGKPIASFTLATSERWKDQNGQEKNKTEWHRISMFGKLAEIAGEYLKKGSQVYIEGKLQTKKWQNQQGQDQYTTGVVVDPFSGVMQMLGGRDGGQSEGGYQQGGQQRSQAPQNPGYQQQPNQGGYQQQPQQGGYNQAPPTQPQSQPQQPMAEPDFDFDDDIPF